MAKEKRKDKEKNGTELMTWADGEIHLIFFWMLRSPEYETEARIMR